MLTEAVEAAVQAYEGEELEYVDKEEREEVDVEALRRKAKELYKAAKQCDNFDNVVYSHFRAAAENVIGMGATRGKIYISDASKGCFQDVCESFQAICKGWK